MSVGQYIPFGLRPDGSLIDPEAAERGLACNCVCPGCREPLMAKKGDVRVHHFSHVGDHSCKNGQTAALLLAAKQVLQTHRRIEVPDLVVTAMEVPHFGRPLQRTARKAQARWDFEAVQLERAIGGHCADVYGIHTDGSAAVVEFRITSQASDEKRRAYRAADLPAVEVDLRPLVGKSLTLEELAKEICDTAENREWLHHPEAAGIERALKEELRARRPLPAAVPAPAALFRGAGPPVYVRRGTDLSMLDAERLAIRKEHERHRALSPEQKVAELEAALGAPPESWPELFGASPSSIRPAVNAPTTLWQGAFFQQFILGALSDPQRRGQSFSAPAANAWTEARFGISQGETMNGVIFEVARFLSHLVAKGYLGLSGDRYLVVRDTLPPPAG